MDPLATLEIISTSNDPHDIMDALRALQGWVWGGGFVPEGYALALTCAAEAGFGFARTVRADCDRFATV
jgi:hypothetical protein